MTGIFWTDQDITRDPDTGEADTDVAEHELRFDAALKVVHEWASTVTEHAVERGAAVSDHKSPDPDRLTLEVMVTNTPIAAPPPSGYAGGSGPTAVTAENGALGFSSEFDRIGDVMFTLSRLRSEPTLVTVVTARWTYLRMSLINVSAPRDTANESITFTLDFVAVRVAETRLVDSPEPREARGRNVSENGAQETADTNGDERNRSVLRRSRDAVQAGREILDNGGSVEDALSAASDAF